MTNSEKFNQKQLEIIDKVRKLFNMSSDGSGATESEAENSFKLAEKLLHKYHLDMSEITSYIDMDSSENMFDICENVSATYVADKLPKWLSEVVYSISLITTTKPLIRRMERVGKKLPKIEIIFVGDVVDTEIASELFQFLYQTINKLSNNHRREVAGNERHKRSFREGCSSRILSRAEEIDRKNNKSFSDEQVSDISIDSHLFTEEDDEDEEEEQDQNSLTLYKEYTDKKLEKIAEHFEDMDIEPEFIKTESKIITESFEKGVIEGDKVPLTVHKKIDN